MMKKQDRFVNLILHKLNFDSSSNSIVGKGTLAVHIPWGKERGKELRNRIWFSLDGIFSFGEGRKRTRLPTDREEIRAFPRISNSIFRVLCDASTRKHRRTRLACRPFNACPIAPRDSGQRILRCLISRIELFRDREKVLLPKRLTRERCLGKLLRVFGEFFTWLRIGETCIQHVIRAIKLMNFSKEFSRFECLGISTCNL